MYDVLINNVSVNKDPATHNEVIEEKVEIEDVEDIEQAK